MRPFLLRSLLLILFLVGLRTLPAKASHLLGGEINYSYLDDKGPAGNIYRYRVTVLVYVNAGSTSQVPLGRPSIDVGFYNKTNGVLIRTTSFPRITNPIITPPQPGGCSTPGASPISVRLVRYEAVVNLPLTFDGYYAVYTDGNRNTGILNLNNSDTYTQLIYVEMAPPLLPNSSPTFSDTAVVVVCQGDTSILVNNAVDADGDRLIYSFSRPYGVQNSQIPPQLPNTFTPPPPAVAYSAGYSQTAPFGTGPGRYAFLNASNGLSSYATALLGAYVVAVEVKEYRKINGVEVLIGSTRREIQLVSRTCQPNRAPQFTPATVATHTYTVEEGQSINFNVAATDVDGNPINLKVNSSLLDGAGGFEATFAGSPGVVQPGNPTGSVTITGQGGNVSGQFAFNSRCGNARNTPYDVVVTATDVACGAKSIADVFQIMVTRAAGPTRVNGDSIICDRAQVRTYSTSGPAVSSYLWSVHGGTIQGSNTSNTVQVRWATTGSGRVTVRGVSALGCPSDSVSRTVDVRPASGLAVTASNATICEGNSTTLTASGAQNYTWVGGGQSFTGATITVSPTQTTTYVVTSTDGICTTSRSLTVTVNPKAVANAGNNALTCSGIAVQLGAAALPGYTYQWSPATGLSSATSAQPTFTLPNTGPTPQVYTLTLTATTAQGCSAQASVQVTVNPAAVANAGPDQVFCSGGTATLGSSNTVAGSTYLWAPATGLSTPTTSSTTVTLTNTGSAPVVNSYILRVTTGLGCVTTDTVRVTVNPASVANAGNDLTTCSGISAQLGTPALPGYTYLWSPATGLSSATVAQPIVQLTNNGTAARQITYTLTATTAQGCAGTDDVTVTINPAAIANAGNDVATCSGISAQLGAAALPGYTYQWSPATGLSSSTSANPTVLLTNTGTTPLVVNYVVTATTAANCFSRDTVQVTINPAAVALAGADRAICSGDNTTLGAAALPGYTYQWSPAAGLSSTSTAQPVFSLTNTGTAPQLYTLTLTVTTAQGCTSQATVRVTVNPAAVANAGPAAALCAGTTVTLGTPALPGYTYLWSPATNLSSATTARPVLTAVNTTQAPITTNYTVTATTAQGCASTATVTVTVNPRPLADAIQGSRSVCPTIQGVVYSILNPRGTGYTWTVVGGTIVSGQGTASITVDWGVANANASVQVIAQNQFTCTGDVVTLPVVINRVLDTPPPVGPTTVCQIAGPVTYSTQLTTGSSYQWAVSPTNGTIVSGQGTASITVQWAQPGNAKVEVQETSAPSGGGCEGPVKQLLVNVLPSPATNLAIGGPTRACAGGGPISFTLPGAASSTYAYTLNGAPIAGTATTVSLPTPAVGTYTLTARETNANTCAGPVYSKQFTVVPALVISGPTNYCPESRTGLTYSVGPLAGTYQWTATGATIVSGQNTGTVKLDIPAGTTTTTLQVHETTSAGCDATFTVRPDNVSVALQAASVLPGDRSIAVSLKAFNNTGNGNQVKITRRDAGTTAAFATVGTVTNAALAFTDTNVDADAKAYDYRLELLNSCGTVLQSQEHTTIRTTVTATEGQGGRDEGKVKLVWSPYRGFDVSEYKIFRIADNGAPLEVAYLPATTLQAELPSSSAGFDQCFRVVAISSADASVSAASNDACVNFSNDLVFYNVITPNNDQLNDVFFIKNIALYPGNTFSVFNRWGREVYKTTNYANTWGAEQQSAGVYYYLLTLPNGKSYKGWFEVVK